MARIGFVIIPLWALWAALWLPGWILNLIWHPEAPKGWISAEIDTDRDKQRCIQPAQTQTETSAETDTDRALEQTRIGHR